MKKLSLIAFCLFFFTTLMAQPPVGNANVGDVYGEKITAGKIINTESLSEKLNSGALQTKIEGKVLEVCPNKGCWIKLQLDDNSVATVKMKDYSFFVPTALEGKRVVAFGKVEMAVTSVNELRHYAQDAKKPQEEIDAINEPKKEIKILANGIEVIK